MEARSIGSLQFMERDGMHMKDDGVGRNPREPKFEIPWECCDRPCIGGGGFSWPPRSYTCSFCKRDFRSAQALGGHMNVHRRDRARLRQSPPWASQDSNTPNTNPNPKQTENTNNPKPSHASSSTSSRPCPITHTFPNLLSCPSSLACISPSPPSTSSSSDARIVEMVLPPPAPLVGNLLSQGHASRTREEAVEPVKLDLEIGLCGNPTTGDLDLELRLGYS